ncbi:Gamma-glutamylputrescine synthetase PuuA [Methyloligella halotolerans]|uniref:Gamma-glutamylputrescine synthetase PuuA n=1 Tax=Methyloligella halotolerans TaxID=1177755 RepID=A0A1E2RX53_9HYPH|nr:glutamine synthetase family protein [Methyloligella halotolerans]ODA66742.1 Gamma-glutamylputrescine synthetase PuuA [Methyloligella halotolerans]
MASDYTDWLAARPEIASLFACLCDLNGTLRGKWLPADQSSKLLGGGIRMPFSTLNVDIWGADIEGSQFVYETGDADGVCTYTGRPLVATDWMTRPGAMALLWMGYEDGAPFLGDPRRALAAICERYAAAGLKPVVAGEFEFYLFDPSGRSPMPPTSPVSGERLNAHNAISISEVQHFEGFLNDVYDYCRDQEIGLDTTISEYGFGQFEVSMKHIDDPLKAADDAILFKHMVRAIARKHGFGATFMAKPYGEDSGSGLHYHVSLLDRDGENVFDDGSLEGSETLQHAVGGLLTTMQECMLTFAPHENSYRRFQPGTHSPASVGWGYENRTAAVRIPGGAGKARRFEHRVAGADANPYLVLASILGGALLGIERKLTPPPPVDGNAYDAELPALPREWGAAIEAFDAGSHVGDIFSPTLQRMLVDCKRQELQRFRQTVTEFEHQTYLEVV